MTHLSYQSAFELPRVPQDRLHLQGQKPDVELPHVPYGLKGALAINFFLRATPTVGTDFPVSYLFSHTRGPWAANASSQVQPKTRTVFHGPLRLLYDFSICSVSVLLLRMHMTTSILLWITRQMLWQPKQQGVLNLPMEVMSLPPAPCRRRQLGCDMQAELCQPAS